MLLQCSASNNASAPFPGSFFFKTLLKYNLFKKPSHFTCFFKFDLQEVAEIAHNKVLKSFTPLLLLLLLFFLFFIIHSANLLLVFFIHSANLNFLYEGIDSGCCIGGNWPAFEAFHFRYSLWRTFRLQVCDSSWWLPLYTFFCMPLIFPAICFTYSILSSFILNLFFTIIYIWIYSLWWLQQLLLLLKGNVS